MSVRGKPAGAAAVFELRSTSMTLVVLALKTTDMAAIEQALVERLADTPGMFDHDPVVIDVAQAEGDAQAIDWQMLAALMWRFDMVAAAVRGGTPQQMAAAFAAGLGQAPEALPPAARAATPAADPPAGADARATAASPVAAPVDNEPAQPTTAGASTGLLAGPANSPATSPAVAPTNAAAAPAAVRDEPVPAGPALPVAEVSPVAPAAPPANPAATLIVDKPLRSGQQVYARNGDLVVLAVVNVGAEVIADGSIHVYAPLRGKAIAGAKGDATARIFSTCMEPQLIAIAGTYRTTDSPLPAKVLGKPAQIRLDGERLVFEPLG